MILPRPVYGMTLRETRLPCAECNRVNRETADSKSLILLGKFDSCNLNERLKLRLKLHFFSNEIKSLQRYLLFVIL